MWFDAYICWHCNHDWVLVLKTPEMFLWSCSCHGLGSIWILAWIRLVWNQIYWSDRSWKKQLIIIFSLLSLKFLLIDIKITRGNETNCVITSGHMWALEKKVEHTTKATDNTQLAHGLLAASTYEEATVSVAVIYIYHSDRETETKTAALQTTD